MLSTVLLPSRSRCSASSCLSSLSCIDRSLLSKVISTFSILGMGTGSREVKEVIALSITSIMEVFYSATIWT